jgi:hypothetical protein
MPLAGVIEEPKPLQRVRLGFHQIARRRRAVDATLTASLLCWLRARKLLSEPRRTSPRMAALAAGVPADVLDGIGSSFGADGGTTPGPGEIVVPKPPIDPLEKRAYRVVYQTAPAWKAERYWGRVRALMEGK